MLETTLVRDEGPEPGAVRLSVEELDLLCHLRGGVDLPGDLRLAPAVEDERELERTRSIAARALLARGLVSDDPEAARRIDRGVDHALGVLHRHEVTLRVLLEAGGELGGYAAAVAGASGALVRPLEGGLVDLAWFRAEELVAQAVRALPGVPAGAGGAVEFPYQVMARQAERFTAGRDDEIRAELAAAGLAGEAAARVVELLRDRTGSGQVTARRRVAGGDREVTTPVPVSWIDTRHGRYLVELRRADGGEVLATLRPATAELLVGRVSELLAGVM
ncbi:ESX secretion-associated protein EspG [Carbonactinospora thermoautotrophica]|nr:ESX secretion-associated protein EspG [Carbonactinospora thermoautotrophica]